jgi:hypothetical protein
MIANDFEGRVAEILDHEKQEAERLYKEATTSRDDTAFWIYKEVIQTIERIQEKIWGKAK